MPELGPSEKKKLDEFKTILSSTFQDFGKEETTSKYPGLDAEHTLMRFLAAKNYDLTKCTTQYSNWRKWVLENNPSQWRATEPPLNDVHQKLHVGNWQGVGKQGHAVYIEKLGACSMTALNKLSSPEKFGLHHMWKNENLMKKNEEQSQKLGKCLYKVINIVDMKGLNMGHRHGISFFAVTAGMDAEYYPETVEQAFVVNAPWVFPAIYSLAKIFIDPNTRQKIHVLSGGVETWSKTILEYVDADQLPAEYGGTAAWSLPDPEEDGEEASLDLEKLVVPAASEKQVSVEVTGPGLIGWYIQTVDKNIEFSVEFVSSSGIGCIVPIKEKEKLNKCEGSYNVDGMGTAYFTFDNKYSYFTSKTVEHSLTFTLNE